MIQKGRQERTVMASLINPINGYRYISLSPFYRGNLELQGIKPKDHRSINKQIIKKKEEENKVKIEKQSELPRIFFF